MSCPDKKYLPKDFIYARIKILPSFEWYDKDADLYFVMELREYFEKENAWSDESWGGLDEALSDSWQGLDETTYIYSGNEIDAIEELEHLGVKESKEYRTVYLDTCSRDLIGHIEE